MPKKKTKEENTKRAHSVRKLCTPVPVQPLLLMMNKNLSESERERETASGATAHCHATADQQDDPRIMFQSGFLDPLQNNARKREREREKERLRNAPAPRTASDTSRVRKKPKRKQQQQQKDKADMSSAISAAFCALPNLDTKPRTSSTLVLRLAAASLRKMS
jgi:hypothetical protein